MLLHNSIERRPAPEFQTDVKPDSKRARMLDVLKLFRVLVRSMDTYYRQVERRSRLGGAQVWALAEIAATPRITVGELARRMAIHLSTASNLVRRLEALGLVKRRRAPDDQRRVELELTAAGGRRLKAAPRPTKGVLQEALGSLPARRILSLERELRHLLAHMRRTDRGAAAMPIAAILDHHAALRARR
jgi:DNA-binding MarR family transcriptional regulator